MIENGKVIPQDDGSLFYEFDWNNERSLVVFHPDRVAIINAVCKTMGISLEEFIPLVVENILKNSFRSSKRFEA